MKTVAQLVISIIKARKGFYEGNPCISVDEYDNLMEDLEEMDPTHPVLDLQGYEDKDDWWINLYEKQVLQSSEETKRKI